MLPRRLATVAVAGLLSLSLASCSGDDGVAANKDADANDDGTASPAEVLELAKTTFDETSGVSFELSTKDLPDGVSGLVSATGVATHAPAFDGVATVFFAGSSVKVDPLVAVDGKVYGNLPLVGVTEFDPGDYGAPDPAELMDPEDGISALLTATDDPEAGETVRGGTDNKEVLTEYSGTVPGDVAQNVIPSASGDFEATYQITEDGELREVSLTGVFYPSSDSMTYTVAVDDYGTEKDITAP